MKFLKLLTKIEKIYIILFIASLFAGVAYGLIKTDYYKCCEDVIGIPPEGTNPIKIFTSNYLLSLSELVTAGLSSFYFNFHTFSVTSSYLNSQGGLFTLPVILFIGVFELIGSLFLALTGLSFVERKFLKIKSNLKFLEMFLFGTSFIFVGAIIEYLLLQLV